MLLKQVVDVVVIIPILCLFSKNNFHNSSVGKTYVDRSFESSDEIRTHPNGEGYMSSSITNGFPSNVISSLVAGS